MKFLLLVWRRPDLLILPDQADCGRHPHQGHPRCSASQPRPTSSQPARGRAPGIPAPLSNTGQMSLLTVPSWPSWRACIQPMQHSSYVSVIYPLLEDFYKFRLHLLGNSKVSVFLFCFFSKQFTTNRKSISQYYCEVHVSNMSYATVSFVTKKCFYRMVFINYIK